MYSNCIFCHANLGANEAIDECERAFRATALRFSTDNIGIARLKEGTELVRVGRPRRYRDHGSAGAITLSRRVEEEGVARR